MAEYVTKEQVIDWFSPYGHFDKPITFETLVSDLRGMTAADVEPVVRCRECKYWHKETLFCDYMPYGEARERVNWYADDFCSYGERKEGAN